MDTVDSEDSCQSTSPLVVSPSSRTSAVWKYFGFMKDDHGKLVKDSCTICKLCSQKVTHGGGTTNLKNHLQPKHRAIYNEVVVSNSSEGEQRSLDAFVRPADIKRLPPHSTCTVST